ncbi:MAG: ribonuclease Z [Prevotellaceae bacterium]|jgi:ribonuclease Z|nr:ribonuclease Z [Prevotellaceae bacterium]
MTFSLTVLGSNSALPAKDRFATAHVLNVRERYFLIDCGEGVQMQLKRFGNVKYSKLDNLFISHLHGDHVFGLFGLLSSLALMGRTADFNIYAHKNMGEILDSHLKYFGENMSYKIVLHAIDPDAPKIIYEDYCMTVKTIPLKHRIPACGFLFKEKTAPLNIYKEAIKKYGLSVADITSIKSGNAHTTAAGEVIPNEKLTYRPYKPRSYAFCSDTMYCEEIAEHVAGVNLLYHEATFLENLKQMAHRTGHSTSVDAAKIAKLAQAKRLLLGHFSSRYSSNMLYLFKEEAKTVFPNTEIAIDGQNYDIF